MSHTKERNSRLLGMSKAQLVMECQDLSIQRDELLAALESLIDMDVSYQRGERVQKAVIECQSVIARVKGYSICKHCKGKGVSNISDPCICKYGAEAEVKPIDQCAECKSMSPVSASMCKKCEHETPAFTEAAINFLKGGAK